MWIDGVLDPARLARLRSEPSVEVAQYSDYAIVVFHTRPRRQHYRYLDPHRFVVQMNDACTELEINFNPSPGEVDKLRDFIQGVRKRLASNAGLLL
jgi:hypothetical protein